MCEAKKKPLCKSDDSMSREKRRYKCFHVVYVLLWLVNWFFVSCEPGGFCVAIHELKTMCLPYAIRCVDIYNFFIDLAYFFFSCSFLLILMFFSSGQFFFSFTLESAWIDHMSIEALSARYPLIKCRIVEYNWSIWRYIFCFLLYSDDPTSTKKMIFYHNSCDFCQWLEIPLRNWLDNDADQLAA